MFYRIGERYCHPQYNPKDFCLSDGRALSEIDLKNLENLYDPDDDETTEYIVGVEWRKLYRLRMQ